MQEKLLLSLGLSGVQAEILACLLANGPQKASNIAKITKRPRGVAYKGLEELQDLGLVLKKGTKAGISIFAPEHPANLEKVMENREKQLNKTKKELAASLPDLISAYNLANNKPGVKFYEGDEGIEKSLEDTLSSQTIIYTFADIEAVEQNIKTINDAYAKKREKIGIKKRIIVADTPFNHKFFKGFNSTLTEIRFLPPKFYNFSSGLQIYDNKISYQIISADSQLAVIIEDKNVYQMNKLIFEYIWETLATSTDSTTPRGVQPTTSGHSSQTPNI